MGLPGYTSVQRVCTPCVAVTSRAPAVVKSLAALGKQLHGLCGVRVAMNMEQGLEGAVEFCQSALIPLSGALAEAGAQQAAAELREKELEEKLGRFQESVVSLAQELSSLC